MDTEMILRRFGREIFLILGGLLLIGIGLLYFNRGTGSAEVQVINQETEQGGGQIVVEVTGAVQIPGVYEFSSNARVDDALNKAGGFTEDADQIWVEKTVNRASKLTDGMKIYIPRDGETGEARLPDGQVAGTININTASQSELESLWGIGPVYAQNIIEHRPYSSVDELLSKGVIKQNVYDRNRDKLTIY